MTDPVFDAIATPVFAGVAIVLLLSVRQVEIWKGKQVNPTRKDPRRGYRLPG